MLTGALIAVISFAYVGLLFAIAYYGDKRADAGRSIIANPYIYTLSLAVYCTSWTFYGSVGRAATSGIGFLPIYLGPTLMAALWWYVLLKMVRISKAHRITSIADFIASRYGKSHLLGGLVTIIAVLGIVPYIALQLKAISASFTTILQYPDTLVSMTSETMPFLQDNTFYVAMLLATFTILFGTRNLDATERHEGLVAAIAFESVVKLVAFIAVGIFVTFGMFDGFDDLFSKAAAVTELNVLLVQGGAGGNYSTNALQISPSLDRAWFGRGLSHAVLKQHENAISDFERAAKLQPMNPHALFELGLQYHALNNQDKVIAVIKRLREFDPKAMRELMQATNITIEMKKT